MAETHDALYGSNLPLLADYIEVHGHETGPGMAEDGDPDSIRLNYAFVPRVLGSTPCPLPLVIPKALRKAPTADLRPILVEKLEAEGLTVRLGDIRFWRTRKPLDVSRIFNDPNVWTQKEGVKRKKFEVLPFTESLISSLGERLQDEKLLHLIVTGGEEPYIRNAHPSIVTMHLPAFQSITMGTFSVGYNNSDRKNWKDVREGERHCQDITITQAPSDSTSDESPGVQPSMPTQLIPTILLGISRLSTGSSGDDMQLLAYASNVHPDSFRIHFDSFGRTLLYNGRLSWMAISPHPSCLPLTAEAIQYGVADSQLTQPRKLGRRYTKLRVPFRKAYERTPNVFSCLSGVNIGGSGSTHMDIRTFVTGIDREGFTLHVEKTQDSDKNVNEIVANAQISWVAFPSGGTARLKMVCGEFCFGDGVKVDKGSGDIEWGGHLAFTEVFSSPPRVFVAFTGFDAADQSKEVTLEVRAQRISQEGMEWEAWTWGNPVSSAAFTYLAVGDR